jgi:hypothetical protein
VEWTDEMKRTTMSELKEYDIYFSANEVPPNIVFPDQWRNFGPPKIGESPVPAEWDNYRKCLPWVSWWVDNCVLGTVLAISDRPYLMYVYSRDGKFYYYMGGEPLGAGDVRLDKYIGFPESLKRFYCELHNGFGFYIGCTMGPSQVEDFIPIKDLCDDEYPDLPDMMAIFSNGAGDYMALGEGDASGEVFIWWHEEPDQPERNLNLWEYMDYWMAIVLENSDVNDIVGE